MTNKTEKPTISTSQFKADILAGMTKAELITKWRISAASVKQLATKFELTIQRAVAPKYILIDDEEKTEEFVTDNYKESVTFESLESSTALNN